MGIIKTISTYPSICFIKHKLIIYSMSGNIDKAIDAQF